MQLLEWHEQLDGGLPDPLGSVGVWLHQAEKILREELVPQQSHEETANAIQQTRQLHQVDEKSQQGGDGNEERCAHGGERRIDADGCARLCFPQEVLRLAETHQQTFQRFHRDLSVSGVPVPAEQLRDMAER